MPFQPDVNQAMTEIQETDSAHPAARILPYGEWSSPIAIAAVAGASTRLGGLLRTANLLWWTEGRPGEQGRNALCRLHLDTTDAHAETVLPPPWNVRNRVHEYGGGTLASDGTRLWFCHDGDAGVHELALEAPAGTAPRLLVAEEGLRFADLRWCAARGSLLAVCEDHRAGGPEPVAASAGHEAAAASASHEPANRLVEILVDRGPRGAVRVLAEGHDFYASPAPSPDGRWLAWLAWRHPAMPWDGTELWCAEVAPDAPLRPRCLAGGTDISVFQPEWSPAGVLHLVSDRSGWWNLECIDPPELEQAMAHDRPAQCRPLCPMAAEFGLPQWEFAMRTYGFEPDGSLLAVARADGTARLGRVADGHFRPIELPWQDHRALLVDQGRVWTFAGAPDSAEALVEIDLQAGSSRMLVAPPPALAPEAVSRPVTVSYPGSGGRETHAFFYPPHLPGVAAPEGEKPPLVVINHGGPTSATSSTLRLSVQFWTTRGIAVLDVNYGGSTGFGRNYRQRLDGQWGVVDVEDAVAGVRWLAAQGLVDPGRTAIRGSSAGGFTALAALVFHDVFRAGVSLYGIGDLSLLATDTHKFEARYLDRLVAPWPEGRSEYAARSPLHHVNRMQAALLLLQGVEDKVVPPNQAHTMYQAVHVKGLPVAMLLFEGEQHGFRRGDTLIRALGAELYFYGRIFGFRPADVLAPLEIANLPSWPGGAA